MKENTEELNIIGLTPPPTHVLGDKIKKYRNKITVTSCELK